MASPTWWTWVWVNSGSWWWTRRPGVLHFMGLQRVGHDWATELNWTVPHLSIYPTFFIYFLMPFIYLFAWSKVLLVVYYVRRVDSQYIEKNINAEPNKYRFEHFDFGQPVKYFSWHSEISLRNTNPSQR